MRKFSGLLITVAALAMLYPAHARAQQVEPRAVTERIAELVDENFYDETRAAQIAAELRAAANAGRYDRATSPADFAAALTAALQPHDGHFRVEYTPPGDTTPTTAPPSPAQLAAAEARTNYNFVDVRMLPGGVGYIDLRGFSHIPDEGAPAREAADNAMTALHAASALVFDLRDCAGGSPAMVGYLVGHFVPADANIYNTFLSRQGEGTERPFLEPRGERRLETPVFVVISGRTGSACESFAYTLQAARRATIVGEASAGGANPGGYNDLGNGLAVFISRGTPVNPITNRNWEGAGVQPDVATPWRDAAERARELALQAATEHADDSFAAREATWALAALRAERVDYPRNLRDYAGDYGARSVAIENGRLALHRDRRPALTLYPIERDLFAVDGALPLQRVQFERDSRGRVIALTLTMVSGQTFRNLRVN